MAAALERLAGFVLRGETGDYVTAAISGAIDGFLLSQESDAATLAFVAKNILVPVVDALGFRLPRGLVHHAVGQLVMTITLLLRG